jgi:hypothetical protein
MDEHSGRRAHLINELIEHFFSALASYSDTQLESLLSLQRIAGQEGHGGEHRNPALVIIDPAATKVEALAALARLREWLASHWEEVQQMHGDAPALVVQSPDDPPPDLLN